MALESPFLYYNHMTDSAVEYPLIEYLNQGISAAKAIELLRQHDCLTFPTLRSGLFPAANFENLEQDETGMANAWLRDSACVGLVLLNTDQHELAVNAVKGVISRLQTIKESFENVIAMGCAPEKDSQRPPVRFAGQDSTPRYDWANAQNDAIGYSLQFIGRAVSQQAIQIEPKDLNLIGLVVTYLDTIKYWEDADSGHWEEIKKVNASSIGTVVAGLRAVQDIALDTTKVAELIKKGNEALNATLPFESRSPGTERTHDAALIFLIEPQHVVSENMATRIIFEAEQQLIGKYGFRRYNGDSYWGPNYREHFQLGDRTADFSMPENILLRDSYLIPGGEAQWTFVDPMVAVYYARRYQKTGKLEDAQQAERFMARSLKTVIVHKKDGSDQIVWRIPELFFLENNAWVPNDHVGLLWSQANLWHGLLMYQEVFGDSPIKIA